jgi:PKD repeat protein
MLRRQPRSRAALLLAGLLAPSAASASHVFGAPSVHGAGVEAPAHVLAVASANGDASPDLLWQRGTDLAVLLGSGGGTFGLTTTYATSLTETGPTMAVGDLDGNGLADTVHGPGPGSSLAAVMFASPTGTYTRQRQSLPRVSGRLPFVADADADGDLDIYLVDMGVTILRNAGSPSFPLASDLAGTTAPDPGQAAVADLDGDGRADVVTRPFDGAAGPHVHFVGPDLGTGEPAVVATVDLAAGLRAGAMVAVADVDGDGRGDVVMHGIDAATGAPVVRAAINAGARAFLSGAAAPSVDRTVGGADLVVGDLDGDGAPDAVLGCGDTLCRMLAVHWGDGGGAFSAASFLPILAPAVRVALADVDCDGDADVVAGARTNAVIVLNLGNRQFEDDIELQIPASDLVAADLNGDGAADLAALAAPGLLAARSQLCGMPDALPCTNVPPTADAGADQVACALPTGITSVALSGAASRSVATSGPIGRYCWSADLGVFAESGAAMHCSPLPEATLEVPNLPGGRTANVTLEVTDFTGCRDADAVVVRTEPEPVVTTADVSSAAICVGETVDLFARATNTASAVGLVTMTWDFDVAIDTGGDGVPDNDADGVVVAVSGQVGVVSATYAQPGTKVARVTAGLAGTSCTDSRDVPIEVRTPPSILSLTGPLDACPEDETRFSASLATASAGALVTWDFDTAVDADGDGDPANDIQAAGTVVTWVFGTGGARTVRARAVDDTRCESFRERAITVMPVVTASFDATSPACNSPIVTFTDTSTALSPKVVTWTFGDGSPALTGSRVSHVYAVPGRYQVTQQVLDGNGCVGTLRREIVVADVELVIASVTFVDGAPGSGSRGNGNGFAEPGEVIELLVTVRNTGDETATDVTATVTVRSPLVGADVLVPTAAVPPIPPGELATSVGAQPSIALQSFLPCGAGVVVEVSVTGFGNSGCSATREVVLPTGVPDIRPYGAERRTTVGPGQSDEPAGVLASGLVYTAFSDTVDGPARIWQVRHAPAGDLIEPPRRLATALPPATAATSPRLDHDPVRGHVGLAWRETAGAVHRVGFARTTLAGEVVGAPVTLTVGDAATAPDVAWTGDHHVVAWADRLGAENFSIWAQLVAADGLVLTPPLRASDALDTDMRHDRVRVASDGATWIAAFVRQSPAGTVLVTRAFQVSRPSLLVALRSEVLGAAADAPPSVVVASSGYVVAWETPAGRVSVATLTPDGRLVSTADAGAGLRPSLARGAESTVVAFEVDGEVVARGVDRNGAVFGATTRVSGGDGPSLSPSLVGSPDGFLLVAWSDRRPLHAANREIYVAALQPGGVRRCDVLVLGDIAPPPGGDGFVNVADVVRALRLAVGLETPTAEDLARGDVAPGTRIGSVHRVIGDGVIDVADVVVLLQASVGLITLTR